MSRDNRELDRLRSGRTELENHYIDELVSGNLSRRDFLRRGSVIGMSAPLLGAILAACGSSSSSKSGAASGTSSAAAAPATKGGTLRIASVTPAAAVNPLTVSDAGGLTMLNQTGEFLIFDSNLKLELQPMLALSWSPNTDGSVWTFKLRPNVTFHNGQAMTADDVVYTFQQLSDTKNASNALSAFGGVLLPSGVKAVDPMTVQFTLEAPNGNFPYAVSSDNYNAIIVPKGTDFGKWQSTFVGTGAFKLGSYTTNVGATFVPNPNYWGTKALLDMTSFKFYSSQPPMILALQGNDVDVIAQFTPAGAAAILNSPSYKIIKLKSANHRELSMRNDVAPFTDPRVRQAVAYTLDRPGAVRGAAQRRRDRRQRLPVRPEVPVDGHERAPADPEHLDGQAAAGGSGPPERVQHDDELRDLPGDPTARAGDPAGCGQGGHHNQAQHHQSDAVLRQGRSASSPWLDGTMSLVDYGDRGSPNVYLTAPLTSSGTWNAAHFKNKQYDSLVKQYVAALDLQTQKTTCRQDREPAAGRDADRLPILDRRSDRVDAERRRTEPDLDRPAVPEHRLQVA